MLHQFSQSSYASYAGPAYLEELVLDILHGDKNALSELYELTATQVTAAAKGLSDSLEDSNEVVADVYRHAWRDIASYDPSQGSVMAWLCELARKSAAELRDYRHPQVAERFFTAADPMKSQFQPGALVHRALERLPPLHRRLIDLAFFNGLSQQQIAEQVHLPVQAVELQLRRARASVHTELAAEILHSTG